MGGEAPIMRTGNLHRLRPARRVVGTVIAFCIPIVIGWYAGYDMLERGLEQAGFLYYAFAVALLTWLCPIWPKEQRNG